MKKIHQEGEPWFERGVSPSFLFVSGLLISAAVLLQQNLEIKAIQTAFFLGLAAAANPSIVKSVVPGSMVFLAVTVLVNLLTPMGRVLLRLGPLPITESALRAGLAKGLTLVCLAYISRFFVRRTLRLPGKLGRYVGKTFFYFNCLLQYRRKLSIRHLVRSLDEVFETAYNQQGRREEAPAAGNTPEGIALVVALLAMNYGLLFLP